MNFLRLSFYILMLNVLPLDLLAQTVSTVAKTPKYKVGYYDVNTKSQTILTVAEKLRVDPAVIQKLNKFKSTNQKLVKGQRIKVPVYPKGYKYDPPKPIAEKQTASLAPSIDENLVEPIYDSIRDNNRLMLIEATLELNETLLEGVKASLDSFNVKEESIVDEKNISNTLHNMKRNRDRALLKPYIEHVGDSLMHQIKLLKAEKQVLEARLKLSAPVSVRNDTVVSGTDTIVYRIATFRDRADERAVLSVKMKDEIALSKAITTDSKKNDKRSRKKINIQAIDTVIVYDLPSTTAKSTLKSEPELQKIDERIEPAIRKWDTARAIAADVESILLERDSQVLTGNRRDSLIAIKTKSPVSEDSMVINAVLKVKEKYTSAATIIEDTIRQASVIENKSQRDLSLSNADSIKRIKAEFFLKRAQKSIAARDLRNAELYVKKSIELSPRYFDAWFTLAEIEDLSGSPQSAIKEYKMCESIDTLNSLLYLNIGNIYNKLKRKTEAFAAYEKSIKINPENIPALMERAAILTDWKRYNEAIRDYDSVLSINRIYHYAYKARGQVKLLTKDFVTAVDDFTRFLIFEETDPSAFYYRGLAKIGSNELLDGCMDLSTSSSMGYVAAEKAIKKSCE